MPLLCVRGPLKALAGGEAQHSLEGDTVLDLLRALEAAHPALAGWILDERAHIRRHINVFVDGEQSEAGTPVAPGARVDVIPAISGGA